MYKWLDVTSVRASSNDFFFHDHDRLERNILFLLLLFPQQACKYVVE